MFQWSSNRRGASTAIQGSIRPPEHSRVQHLDSYLKDATLQRSTRRVPPGESNHMMNASIVVSYHISLLTIHP